MEKNDLFALLSFVLLIVVAVVAVAAFLMGAIDVFVMAVIVVLAILLLGGTVLALGVGIHAAVKKKDTVHEGSGMTLGDVKEVDREMEDQSKSGSGYVHSTGPGSGLSTDDKKQ